MPPIYHGWTIDQKELDNRQMHRKQAHIEICLKNSKCPKCLGTLVVDTKMGMAGDDYEERLYCPNCGRSY